MQNSGLFFSSAVVRKNAACLSSFPTAAAHHLPPPTSHRPSTRHRSRLPVHRVAHAPSRASSKHAEGWAPCFSALHLNVGEAAHLIRRLLASAGRVQGRKQPAHERRAQVWERASTRRSVAASANSVFGVRRCVTIGLFTMLYTIRSGCGPWDRLGRSPHLVAAALSRMLWGEAGRCTPRGSSRRGVDSCHVAAVETSMPGHGWIARMKSTTRARG